MYARNMVMLASSLIFIFCCINYSSATKLTCTASGLNVYCNKTGGTSMDFKLNVCADKISTNVTVKAVGSATVNTVVELNGDVPLPNLGSVHVNLTAKGRNSEFQFIAKFNPTALAEYVLYDGVFKETCSAASKASIQFGVTALCLLALYFMNAVF